MTTMAPPCTAERRGSRAQLSTGPAAAAEARRRVRAAIASWHIPVDQDAALLLTSELVTNAVRHEPGQAVMLVISCSRGRLRVDVHDTARTLPAVADVPADAESGRGLLLVETLSDEWGFYRTPAGKAVYFTLVFGADQAPATGGRGRQRVHARGRWTETPPSAHRPRRAAPAVPAARPPSALGTSALSTLPLA
jgi:anti-sigma regulatory factor (Ser/Thr protein kinase)